MNKILISTDRLTLRLIEISDLDVIHKLHALPETDAYNALGIPKNIEETKAIIEPWLAQNNLEEIKNYTFAIELRKTLKFIGLFGVKLSPSKYKKGEVWYKIHVGQWNKGYATEVLKGMISYGFNTLKLHRIEAGCAVENIGSIKVLENSGMIR
ncbi:MAG: ribosomal-protein-alanine N-acetyltransferase [Psychroserpens sp.]|jgi:ribosomal-protein-alanine N-acetyltransferase